MSPIILILAIIGFVVVIGWLSKAKDKVAEKINEKRAYKLCNKLIVKNTKALQDKLKNEGVSEDEAISRSGGYMATHYFALKNYGVEKYYYIIDAKSLKQEAEKNKLFLGLDYKEKDLTFWKYNSL